MHLHINHPYVLYIMEKDRHFKPLFERVNDVFVTYYEDGFSFLIFTITGQQVSAKVAQTLYQRIVSVVGTVSKESILDIEVETLRKIGLSYRKIETMKRLALYVSDPSKQPFLWYDEKDIQSLLEIKGIGPWTIDMYYMFVLKKLDYFSFLDLGLIEALKYMYNKPIKDIFHMKQIVENIAPYQSVLAHYLWAYWDDFHKKRKLATTHDYENTDTRIKY